MKDQKTRTVFQEAYKLFERNESPEGKDDWCKYVDECMAYIDKWEGNYATLAYRLADAGFEAQCEIAGYTHDQAQEFFKKETSQ